MFPFDRLLKKDNERGLIVIVLISYRFPGSFGEVTYSRFVLAKPYGFVSRFTRLVANQRFAPRFALTWSRVARFCFPLRTYLVANQRFAPRFGWSEGNLHSILTYLKIPRFFLPSFSSLFDDEE